MIEMLGELMRAVLRLIKKGEFQQATIAINEMYYNLLRKDAAFFHKIPIDDLAKSLLVEHNYTNNHLEILAELFYAEAELQLAQNKFSESLTCFQKALKLFEFIEKNNKNYSIDRESKIELIKNKIKDINTIEDI